MFKRNAADGRLRFTTDVVAEVHHGTLQFIGVGTPPDEDGSADLQYVLAAARSIGQHMTDDKVTVDKSTVPVGTANRVRAVVQEVLAERGVSVDFAVVSNLEFLKEGAAVKDFMRPDRIIIGADDERGRLLMRAICAPFSRNLYAGSGYGGSCFPKDVKALVRTGHEATTGGHRPARADRGRGGELKRGQKRGQYTYLWELLADGRRIVGRGRGDREDLHLAVSFFCKLADPRAGPCETRDSLSIVPRVQIAR